MKQYSFFFCILACHDFQAILYIYSKQDFFTYDYLISQIKYSSAAPLRGHLLNFLKFLDINFPIFFPVFILTIVADQFTEILNGREIYYPASVREKNYTDSSCLALRSNLYLIKAPILIMQLESSIFLYQKGMIMSWTIFEYLANKIYLIY